MDLKNAFYLSILLFVIIHHFKQELKPKFQFLMRKKINTDYQLGYFVGHYIYDKKLPCLSTELERVRNIINVGFLDALENKKLRDNWADETDETKKQDFWLEYKKHNNYLVSKYIPKEYSCHVQLLQINNFRKFKKGLIDFLYQAHVSYYSLKPEDIKVTCDDSTQTTTIKFKKL